MPFPVYRAEPPALRRVTMLEDFTLLYHRRSGTTHLLAQPAPEILDALDQGPADIAEILHRLSAQFGLEAEGNSEAVIVARIAELVEIGLIEAL